MSATSRTRQTRKRPPAGPPDTRVIKAIGHPLRRAILVALNEKEGSPTELARALHEPVNLVAYHTGILAEAGAIELVRTEPRRGSTEHYYRAIMRPFFEDREWAELSVETRRTVFGQDIKRIMADVRQAAADTGFDHPKAHVSWTTFDLDERGFTEAAAVLRRTLDELLEIQARAAGRQAKRRSGTPAPLATEVAMLQFERRDTRLRRRLSES
jgi:DNA-binding transcriptional ArsR family regulator